MLARFHRFTLSELYSSFNSIIKIRSQCFYQFCSILLCTLTAVSFSLFLWSIQFLYFFFLPPYSGFAFLCNHFRFSSCLERMYPEIFCLLMLHFRDNLLNHFSQLQHPQNHNNSSFFPIKIKIFPLKNSSFTNFVIFNYYYYFLIFFLLLTCFPWNLMPIMYLICVTPLIWSW